MFTFGRKIMDDLIDCKKQSHDTNSFTEHQILDQCKTKGTENFFKCGEGSTLNNRRRITSVYSNVFV
jgi:hypothetical protein